MIWDGTKDEWRERGKNLDCQTKDKRDKRRRGDEDTITISKADSALSSWGG